MKIGKVFAKLESNPKCASIAFEEIAGEGDKTSTVAVVTLAAGYTNEGASSKTCVSAHETRLFIEGAVDAEGNRRVKRAKPANEAEATGEVEATGNAEEATGNTVALSPGFIASAGEQGEVVNRTSKKVTLRLTPDQRETYITFAQAVIDNPEANIGAKGSARAALTALAA